MCLLELGDIIYYESLEAVASLGSLCTCFVIIESGCTKSSNNIIMLHM